MKLMKKIVAVALVVMSLVAVALPALATSTGTYNTSAVNLRSTIGGTTSLGLVSKGATCNILEQQTLGGILWYKVKITSHTKNSPDLYNKTGWSHARYITTNSTTIPEEKKSATSAFGTRNLTTGSSGNYVRNVQSCLMNAENKYGEAYYTGLLDGDFGNLTFRAVCNFQSENGLTSDGIVGEKTRNLLWSKYSQYCTF